MRTIRFSVDDEQYHVLARDAEAKGLSVAQYAKMAAFAYVSKYPAKGVMRELADIRATASEG